jgi:hypothetical protein
LSHKKKLGLVGQWICENWEPQDLMFVLKSYKQVHINFLFCRGVGMKQKDKVVKRIEMSNLITDNGKRD